MDNLTAEQHQLYQSILREAGRTGEDTRDLLVRDRTAAPQDKAAVADALGGPGAGDEFR